jgi:hypothetical protein
MESNPHGWNFFLYIYCRVFLYNFLFEKLQGEKLKKAAW